MARRALCGHQPGPVQMRVRNRTRFDAADVVADGAEDSIEAPDDFRSLGRHEFFDVAAKRYSPLHVDRGVELVEHFVEFRLAPVRLVPGNAAAETEVEHGVDRRPPDPTDGA